MSSQKESLFQFIKSNISLQHKLRDTRDTYESVYATNETMKQMLQSSFEKIQNIQNNLKVTEPGTQSLEKDIVEQTKEYMPIQKEIEPENYEMNKTILKEKERIQKAQNMFLGCCYKFRSERINLIHEEIKNIKEIDVKLQNLQFQTPQQSTSVNLRKEYIDIVDNVKDSMECLYESLDILKETKSIVGEDTSNNGSGQPKQEVFTKESSRSQFDSFNISQNSQETKYSQPIFDTPSALSSSTSQQYCYESSPTTNTTKHSDNPLNKKSSYETYGKSCSSSTNESPEGVVFGDETNKSLKTNSRDNQPFKSLEKQNTLSNEPKPFGDLSFANLNIQHNSTTSQFQNISGSEKTSLPNDFSASMLQSPSSSRKTSSPQTNDLSMSQSTSGSRKTSAPQLNNLTMSIQQPASQTNNLTMSIQQPAPQTNNLTMSIQQPTQQTNGLSMSLFQSTSNSRKTSAQQTNDLSMSMSQSASGSRKTSAPQTNDLSMSQSTSGSRKTSAPQLNNLTMSIQQPASQTNNLTMSIQQPTQQTNGLSMSLFQSTSNSRKTSAQQTNDLSMSMSQSASGSRKTSAQQTNDLSMSMSQSTSNSRKTSQSHNSNGVFADIIF